jgi:hypothetical protein
VVVVVHIVYLLVVLVVMVVAVMVHRVLVMMFQQVWKQVLQIQAVVVAVFMIRLTQLL